MQVCTLESRLFINFIANYLNRDHATVLHACKKYDDLYKTDDDFKKLADHLIGRFNTIDAREETMFVKKALTDLIDNITEKDRARIYAVAVDILEGKSSFYNKEASHQTH